jgi:hypothetical protein
MRLLLPTFLSTALLLTQMSAGAAQSSAAPASSSETSSPQQENSSQSSGTALPIDQQNAAKAKQLLQEAIEALGGAAYLKVHDMEQAGRGYSFHHGNPTSNGIKFWRFVEFPDKERVELTEQRDIAEVYNGNKGFEITFKGPHPIEPKDLEDYLRRRKFSLDTILRTWVNDPTVALFYEGYADAANHPALRIELINAKDESVALFLDTETRLPIKKMFSWRDPVDKQKNIEEEIYDDYRRVQGIMTPYNFTRLFNGDMASQRFLNSAAYDKGLNPAMFDPNSGYNPNKQQGKR